MGCATLRREGDRLLDCEGGEMDVVFRDVEDVAAVVGGESGGGDGVVVD